MITLPPDSYLEQIESGHRIEIITSPGDGALYIGTFVGKTDDAVAGSRLEREIAIEMLTKLMYGVVHRIKVTLVFEAYPPVPGGKLP